MKKLHFRRIISAMLVLTLLCATMPITALASSPDDLVDVVVYEDGDQSIVACVPRSDLAAFEENLKDPAYRQAQIDTVLGVMNPSKARVLPEGNILSEQDLYESDIEEFVDAAAGTGTFNNIIGIGGATIGTITITKLVNAAYTTAAGMAAGIFTTSLADMLSRQESWWTTSYIKILNGDISCVRYTIIENTSDYPKIWRVLERI